MKVLVTGANGYLGVGIVKAILDLGNQVIAADLSTARVDERAEKYTCEIFSIDDPYEFFGHPDCLLHLAWRDGFVHYSDAHIEDLPKHKQFIERIAKSGVSSISVMGTMHEIGFYEGAVDENTPCNPMSYYGIAKNALREVTAIICKKNQVYYKWLRAFYIVSNSVSGSSVFAKIAQAESRGEVLFPFTSGDTEYDFLDYDEFCFQVASATIQNTINGIINICHGKPERLGDRVERFIQDNNYKIKLNYGAFPDRPYDSKAIWGDNKKISAIIR